jgi:predicted dehydrogenase
MDSIGVGIIGQGFGAKVQLPGFSGLDGVHVVGIAGRDGWQALVESPDVQLISVSSPPFTHEEIVSAAIAAGKHVLCEKPFTLNTASAQRLLDQAEEAGIVHGVDFEFRELPALQKLHERLNSGELGNVQRAEFNWVVGTWADPKIPWRWQCDKAQCGGIVGALGVHLFDAVEWLIGPVETVKGHCDIKIPQRPDRNTGDMKPVTAEDHANIDMTLASGTPIQVQLSNVDSNGSGLTIHLECERGILRLESASQDYAKGLRVIENDQVLLNDEAVPGIDGRIAPFQKLATRLTTAIRDNNRGFKPSFTEGMRSTWIREQATLPYP